MQGTSYCSTMEQIDSHLRDFFLSKLTSFCYYSDNNWDRQVDVAYIPNTIYRNTNATSENRNKTCNSLAKN